MSDTTNETTNAANAATTEAAAAATEAKKNEVIGKDQPVPAGQSLQVFHFKKEVLKDAAGNKIGDGKKLPSVALLVPLVTAETVLTLFTDPSKVKEQQFMLDSLQQQVYLGARDQINAFREKNSAADSVPLDVLDHSKLTIEALALAAEESGSASRISEDDWESFYDNWKEVMLATPWTAEEGRAARVEAQLNLFRKQLRRSRDKKLLNGVRQLLDIYAANAGAGLTDNAACYENINGYVEKWRNYEPQDLLASILG